MGQAKLKGNREQRVAQAIEKMEALKPEYIVCNNCQAKLTEITTLNSRNMSGIEAVFGARCLACDHDTFAILGDPEAVSNLSLAMGLDNGHEMEC